MPDDAELLRCYVATLDQQAFAELVARHVDAVFSAALRRVGGDVHFAEDVTQQVFVALARKAADVSRHPFLGGWLYTTTRNEAANVVRRERRRKAREQSASALKTNADESGAADADWQHLAPVLDDAIDTLAERDRAAIVLRFIERRGFSEIGTALEVSTDAARMRVERALEKLRQCLVRRGVTSTAGALGIALTAHAASPAPFALAASVTSTALASAAVATGVTPWIAFMGLTKLHTTLAATVLLVGGAAYHGQHVLQEQQSRHSAARAALVAASARADDLARAVGEATARHAELERQVDAARSSRTPASVVSDVSPAGDAQLEIIRQQARIRQSLARTHPEYQRLSREVARRDLWRQYGALYQALKLTPERVAEFERVMVDHDWHRVDVESAGRAQGLPDSDPAIARLLGEIEARRDAALRQLLGSDQHAQYQRFHYAERIRCEFTEWMAGALYETAMPLTGTQASRLTEILTRHTTADEENRASKVAIRWEDVLPEARGVLLPPQMQFLESLRAQMDWRKAFYAAIGSIEEKPVVQKAKGG